MPKRLTRKNIIILVITIPLVLLAILVLCFAPAIGPIYARHSLGYSMEYEALQPAKMPGDLKVTPTELSVIDHTGWVSKSVTFTSSSENLSFTESQDPGSIRMDCSVAPTNSDCKTIQTRAGNTYVFMTRFVDEAGNATPESYQTIQYTKDGAYFYLEIQDTLVNTYTEAEWSDMIDSMRPLDVKSLPIKVEKYKRFGG